jgi:hypothetical protein
MPFISFIISFFFFSLFLILLTNHSTGGLFYFLLLVLSTFLSFFQFLKIAHFFTTMKLYPYTVVFCLLLALTLD